MFNVSLHVGARGCWYILPWQKIREFSLFLLFQNCDRDLFQYVTAYGMLGLSYGHCMFCLNNRILDVPSIHEVITLFVKSLVFLPPLGLGYIKNIENKWRWIRHSLGCPPASILCLCSFLLYLFFLLTFLIHIIVTLKFVKAEPWQLHNRNPALFFSFFPFPNT